MTTSASPPIFISTIKEYDTNLLVIESFLNGDSFLGPNGILFSKADYRPGQTVTIKWDEKTISFDYLQ